MTSGTSSDEAATGAPSAAEGISLLGQEMLTWSDLGSGEGGVRGSLASLLLRTPQRRCGRALVAGPHTAAVVHDVAGFADHTDVLVRAYPDAEALRAELPATIGVLCGPLGRLPAETASYDVVVALDGLDRLHSAEQDRPDPQQVADQLAAVVAPDGDLFLAVPNAIGLDTLLSLEGASRRGDEDWPEGRVSTSPARGSAGSLRAVERWCCFGPRHQPLLAVPTGLLESEGADPRLVRLVSQATSATTVGPAVTDPRTAVAGVVAAGLGAALAPKWIVHLTSRTEDADQPEAGPRVLVAEAPADRPAVPHRLRVGTDAWVREPVKEATEVAWAASVRCDPARLSGPILVGASLEDLLADGCAAHDLVAVGGLVRRYGDWLADPAGEQVPGERVCLTLADLVATDEGGIAVADGRLMADEPAPLDEVLLRTLLVAADRLLASGSRHPWSATATPAVIARSLAASAGIEVEPPLMDRAVALDGRLRPDPVDYLAVAPPAPSYAELVDQVAEYRQRLTEAEAQLEWLVSNIHVRQRALRASRGRVGDLESSAEYRIGKRVLPFRALAKKGRDWARERREGPMHEWRAKPHVRDPIPVDPDLLPEGYKTKGDEV